MFLQMSKKDLEVKSHFHTTITQLTRSKVEWEKDL